MEFPSTTDTRPLLSFLGQILSPEAAAGSGGDWLRARGGAVDWPLLVSLASQHMVTPALYPRFGHAGVFPYIDDELHHYFETITTLNRDRNLHIYGQMLEITRLLNSAGIVPIFLKGTAHLLLGLYNEIADRVIGDIDLLVGEDQFEKTIGTLTSAGYASVKGHTEHAHHHHFPPLARDDSAACVEVHKTPVASPYGRTLSASMLVRRARAVRIDGNQAAVPCPEDLLVHNVIHAQLANRGFWSAEFWLRDAYDLVLLGQRFGTELDWQRLGARLDADVGRSCAAFYLRRAHQLFGQSPPPLSPTLGARLADWRWALHARGRMVWLRRTTQVLAYASQALLRIAANPAKRRRSLRRIATRS